MSAQIIDMNVAAALKKLTPESVLHAAQAANLKSLIVLGETQDGSMFMSMSTDDVMLINWQLDCAKKAILDAAEDGDE